MLKTQKAFTLIELMVTLSVFGVLAFLALPSFQKQIANNQSLLLSDEMTAALNFARTEAIKRGKFVTLCPANADGTNCGTDWLNGWLVVVDTAASETTKPPTVANDTAILRRWERRDNTSSIVFTPSTRQFIRYTGLGVLARAEGDNSATITLKVNNCSGNAKKIITISLSGMLTTASVPCP
jgi:type IV fimbrial biogenesis protein FimT